MGFPRSWFELRQNMRGSDIQDAQAALKEMQHSGVRGWFFRYWVCNVPFKWTKDQWRSSLELYIKQKEEEIAFFENQHAVMKALEDSFEPKV